MTDSEFPTFFFIVFWVFIVMVLVNVLISLILEIYSAVEPEVSDQAKKRKLTQALVKIIEGMEGESLT